MHADVFKDRKSVQEHEILEYKAEFLIPHFGNLFLIQFGEINVFQRNDSLIIWDKAGDAVRERCLACLIAFTEMVYLQHLSARARK